MEYYSEEAKPMVVKVVLAEFAVVGIAFMLWVIFALEVEIHRIQKRSSQLEQALRRR